MISIDLATILYIYFLFADEVWYYQRALRRWDGLNPFVPISEIQLCLGQSLPLLKCKDRKILEIIWKLGFLTNISNVYASIPVFHTCVVYATITVIWSLVSYVQAWVVRYNALFQLLQPLM